MNEYITFYMNYSNELTLKKKIFIFEWQTFVNYNELYFYNYFIQLLNI